AQRVLSGQRSRIIARSARRRLFHSHSDRSAVAHNARIDVSCAAAEPARACGGGVESVAAPATRRATDRANRTCAFSAAHERSPAAVCCPCSRRLLVQLRPQAISAFPTLLGAERT